MISIFAFSKKGMETARRVALSLGEAYALYAAERIAEGEFSPVPKPSSEFYRERFFSDGALIFVSSCGIAVRSIAPFIVSKTSDPAVIAIDETGRFAVSLLSGHIGGANALARRIAEAIGAEPVITTATDVNGRFSVDSWAETHGFAISDMGMAKKVSAAILEGDVPVKSDLPITGELPAGLKFGEGETGVYLTYRTDTPFPNTLRLVPKCLHIGIGCRRGISKEAIENAADRVFSDNGLDMRAIKSAASIDIKSGEAGLIEFCRGAGLPISFYSAERLNGLRGEFSSSDFVKSVAGTDCVSERAAMMGADELIVKKTAMDGVTIAVSLAKTEVIFG